MEKSVFSCQYVDEDTSSQIRLEASETTSDWYDTIKKGFNKPALKKFKSAIHVAEGPGMHIGKFALLKRSATMSSLVVDNETAEIVTGGPGSSFSEETEEPEENFLLGVQCMKFNQGDHVAVMGGVSSGKSTFLRAILGEMICHTGHVSVHGSIAYCSQEPWIFNGTILSNIILDSPMDDDWYSEVIKATCLIKDISSMPDGDSTEIGDGGDSLSGGQKQRISLARAIYARKDIYVLDDPLSALDIKISNTLFDMCFNNLLADATIIMVLNQLDFQHHFHSTVLLEAAVEGAAEERKLKMSVARLIPTETAMATATMPWEAFDDVIYVEKRKSLLALASHLGSSWFKTFDEGEVLGTTSWSSFFDFTHLCGWSILLLCLFLYIMKSALSSSLTLLVGATANESEDSIPFASLLFIFYFGSVICFIPGYFLLSLSLIRGGRIVHNALLKTILRAPMSYFDATPLEGVMNLFTTDVLEMDYLIVNEQANLLLARIIDMFFFAVVAIIAIPVSSIAYILASIAAWYLIVHLVPVSSVSMLYMCNVREYHLGVFGSIMDGIHTIHAFGLSDNIQASIVDTLEHINKSFFNTWHIVIWARARICTVPCIMVTLGVFLIVW